jgi:hypothetical protein
MLKGSKEASRQKFIKEMAAGGTESVAAMIIAYKRAYPNCKKDETARTSAYALLRIPHIYREIDRLKTKREEIIEKAQKEELERIAREQIASQSQLEAVLSMIATGKYRRTKVIAAIDPKTQKVISGEVEESPSETDMVSAADKLLKIKGAYVKDNVIKHEAGDAFIELMKQRAKSKKNVQQ